MKESPFDDPVARPKSETTGILPFQAIQALIDGGSIIAPNPDGNQIQPASIDLRLGRKAFQIAASFLPGHSSIEGKIKDLLIREIDLEDSAVLEPRSVFLVPLMESLRLPADVSGVANPKSTTGRLDVFTRLITEPGIEFERVPKGYQGALYLEIVSRTFPIRVRTGMKLNQLRLLRGRPQATDGKLVRLAEKEPVSRLANSSPLCRSFSNATACEIGPS